MLLHGRNKEKEWLLACRTQIKQVGKLGALGSPLRYHSISFLKNKGEKMLIYDIEIKKAILGKNETEKPGIEYCEGWGDHVGMGVSTVCCYDYDAERSRVFCDDNMDEFRILTDQHDILVGYNNIKFDNAVLAYVLSSPDTNPVLMKNHLDLKSYDILAEIRKAAGCMIGLDAMVKVNGLAIGKTGNGALAPVWYQAGQWGRLVDYCLADVELTKMLLDKIMFNGILINPRGGADLVVESPYPDNG